MSKAKRTRTPRQCVCCGFRALKGTKIGPDKFVCVLCESDQADESAQRHEDEEYLETARLEAYLGRMETY